MRSVIRRSVNHKAKRDPAPSRWAYRMQRMWLTPFFRVLMRRGLPAFAVVMAVGLYLGDDARRAAIVDGVVGLRTQFEQRPEFLVGLVSVHGASLDLAEAIRAKVDLKLPQSSFDIDLDAVRARVESLDAVAKAEVRVRAGGILHVEITERVPEMVWRTGTSIELLDATGHRVAGLAARSDRPDLPLIAGVGADKAANEALAVYAAAQPILPRVRGLVRMGERRWDIMLDRDQRILLPAENPVQAVERLIALDQVQDLLARDILTVDLRNEHRPVLRLSPFALEIMRQGRGIAAVETKL
jgi:cell division protein FtsQ